jgi:hypothetical protein
MTHLPTESIQRIADARRNAETELKKALSGVRESDDVAPYLSAFTSFASALFDAEAGELLTVCEDSDRFQTALENAVAPRIIEGVLPDRSLNRVPEHRTDGVNRLLIRHDMDTDLLSEGEPDGTWKPAGAEVLGVYAQHGDWENFMPNGVQFLLRWPGNNSTVRAALSQALQKRAYYWAGQFHMRATAGGSGAPSRLRRLLAELPKTSEHGDESTRAGATPTVNPPDGNGANQRAAVNAFISKLSGAGRRITRKQIWTVAGYKTATELERFQRGDTRVGRTAAMNIRRVLNMEPENFFRLLDKKSTSK